MATDVTLNTGHAMPVVGPGDLSLQGRQATDAVLTAIEAGYRLLDTAAAYGNEAAVGAGVRESGLPRRISSSRRSCAVMTTGRRRRGRRWRPRWSGWGSTTSTSI